MSCRPPVVEARSHVFEVGACCWEDPYEWLRQDQRAQEELLQAEALWAADALKDLQPMMASMASMVTEEAIVRDLGSPQLIEGRWLLPVLRPGAGNPQLVAVSSTDVAGVTPTAAMILDGAVPYRILLDLDAELRGRQASVGAVSLSPDGRLLAWSEDPTGAERFTIHVKDIESGRELLTICEVAAHAEFCRDSCHMYVVELDVLGRPCCVVRHDLWRKDCPVVVLEEPDDAWRLRLRTTRSREFLILESSARTHNRLWVLRGHDDPKLLNGFPAPARIVLEHASSLKGEWWVVLVHDDQHPNGELRLYSLHDMAHPRVLVAHDEDRTVAPPLVVNGRVAVMTQEVGTDLLLFDLDAEPPKSHLLAHSDGPISVGKVPAWEDDVLTVNIPSHVVPPRGMDVPLVPSCAEPLRLQLPETGPYCEEQLTVSAQGVKVPLTVVRRRDIRLPAPLLLVGYGSYGVSMATHFNPLLQTLVDQGVVYAIAHVRGGGEKGRAWHDAGRKLNKPNSVNDLMCCLDHLEATGVTVPGRVVLMGGSAGGTLMAATLNKSPWRFAGAVLDAPFVDVLASMVNPELPLTISDRSEWGDPLASEAALACIRSYSPYENLSDQAYPPILVTVRCDDTRVPPVQALKYVQRFRQRRAAGSAVLLPAVGGHAGGASIWDSLRLQVLQYAWVAVRLGVDLPGGEYDRV